MYFKTTDVAPPRPTTSDATSINNLEEQSWRASIH